MDKTTSRTATLIIMALFGLQPMAFGAWLAMIPYIKDTLGLTNAQLAMAMIGQPLALIAVLQPASRIVSRVGPRRTFQMLLPVQTLIILTPFLATGIPTLFLSLVALGAVVAFMEVSLNTYAGRLEKASGEIIMSRCHGFWSLGVMVGSFCVTQLFGMGPVLAVILTAGISAGLGVLASTYLPRLAGQGDGTPTAKPQKLSQMPRVLFLIALFIFCVTLVEGAAMEWSAVYYADRWGADPATAGISVTVFAGFLAAGRFLGDWLNRKLGVRGVARFTICLTLIGLVLATVPSGVVFLFIGLAFMGLGTSIGFPLGISAAASLSDEHEAQNIATAAMIAMSSFLLGPPLIGFVAELTSLRGSYVLMIPVLLIALLLSRILPERESAAKETDSPSESHRQIT